MYLYIAYFTVYHGLKDFPLANLDLKVRAWLWSLLYPKQDDNRIIDRVSYKSDAVMLHNDS